MEEDIQNPQKLDYAHLKDKQRKIRENFPTDLALKVHRALSWLQRAELEKTDNDVQFLLLWIGFNAAYTLELEDNHINERERLTIYFERLISHERQDRIYYLIWRKFPFEIKKLLDNRYIFAPFWKYHNGDNYHADWQKKMDGAKYKSDIKLKQEKDTAFVLSVVFDRLYVLRNQLYMVAQPGTAA